MDSAILLASSYIISLAALVSFIVGMIRGWFDSDARGAKVLFAASEIGTGSSIARA